MSRGPKNIQVNCLTKLPRNERVLEVELKETENRGVTQNIRQPLGLGT